MDVETDGPVPGPFSMLSFGMVAVGRFDGRTLSRVPSGAPSFYRELRPISERFQPEAMEVNGLDRASLQTSGSDPATAMVEAATWIDVISAGCRPVFVGYPVVFDWSFVNWYFEVFAEGRSPFGHSSCLDIRSIYLAVAGTVFEESGRAAMPESLSARRPHTHNALEDAIEQGELFMNVFGWAIQRSRLAPEATRERRYDSAPSWMTERVHNLV